MIVGINESKILSKHVSCKYKCNFDGRKCNSYQKWNNNKVDVSVKNIIFVKRDCIWRRTTSNSENGKYFTSIIYDSVITSSEVIEKTETVPTNFNEKKQPV